jgi:hypothetical protein
MAEGLRTTQDDTKVCSLDGAAFLSRTIGRDRGILTTPGGIRIAVWGKAYNFTLQSSRPVNRPQKLPNGIQTFASDSLCRSVVACKEGP